jgi:hypothetical protein
VYDNSFECAESHTENEGRVAIVKMKNLRQKCLMCVIKTLIPPGKYPILKILQTRKLENKHIVGSG